MTFQQGSSMYQKDDLIVLNVKSSTPTGFSALQNTFNIALSPNPANTEITFTIDLAQSGITHIELFDVSGKSISTVVEGFMPKGKHNLRYKLDNLRSGIYTYRLSQNGQMLIGQFTVAR